MTKQRLFLPILTGLLFVVLVGCKSPSSPFYDSTSLEERGTWVGEASTRTIYELNGKAVEALCILTKPGAVKNRKFFLWDKADQPVLIDKKGVLIDYHPYIGKKIKVRGEITVDAPINPADSKLLTGVPDLYKKSDNIDFFSCVIVITIDPAKIHILSQ